MIKTFKAEGIPNAIKLFEKLLSTNGGKFFVGKEVCFFTSYLVPTYKIKFHLFKDNFILLVNLG